jgi:L-amino acid N-acyltransferase YncA
MSTGNPRQRRIPLPSPGPPGYRSPMPTVIRPARTDDIAAVNRIYGHYVETCTCTWEENDRELVTAESLGRRGHRHPLLVAELDGVVVAWGSLSPYNLRSGWRHTVEDSIFVSHLHQGKGLGRQMLGTLIAQAKSLGYRQIVARISGNQAGSLGLHQALGFKEAGRLKAAGRKFDQWLDCVYLQLDLGEPKP